MKRHFQTPMSHGLNSQPQRGRANRQTKAPKRPPWQIKTMLFGRRLPSEDKRKWPELINIASILSQRGKSWYTHRIVGGTVSLKQFRRCILQLNNIPDLDNKKSERMAKLSTNNYSPTLNRVLARTRQNTSSCDAWTAPKPQGRIYTGAQNFKGPSART